MKSSSTTTAEAIDWLKGSKMGYTYFDKLKIFLCILNVILAFFILVTILGGNDQKATKFLLKKPKVAHCIPIKNTQIVLDGLRFQIPAEFDYLIYVKSDWERKERDFVSNLTMTNGDFIIDVGANIGHYTNLLAKKYPNNQVYSIEASSENFQYLQINCKLNGLEKDNNVILYNKAISNTDGQTIDFFERGTWSTINKQILKDWLVSDKYIKKYKVQTITLDSLINQENLQRIALLKIDIENHEEKALLGAYGSLKSKKIQNLVIEYHTHSGKNKILQMLDAFGYLCSIDERPIMFENGDYANGHIFAVLRSHLDNS